MMPILEPTPYIKHLSLNAPLILDLIFKSLLVPDPILRTYSLYLILPYPLCVILDNHIHQHLILGPYTSELSLVLSLILDPILEPTPYI